MKLLRKEMVENCLPSAPEYRYEFSEPWSAETIRRLTQLGDLDYYAHFPRPFFRVRWREGALMRGVEGEARCRVIFAGEHASRREEFDRQLELLLEAHAVSSKEVVNGSSPAKSL